MLADQGHGRILFSGWLIDCRLGEGEGGSCSLRPCRPPQAATCSSVGICREGKPDTAGRLRHRGVTEPHEELLTANPLSEVAALSLNPLTAWRRGSTRDEPSTCLLCDAKGIGARAHVDAATLQRQPTLHRSAQLSRSSGTNESGKCVGGLSH